MDKALRYLSLVFSIVFIAFTLVQYDDPDRSVWIFIYVVAAAVSLSAFANKFDRFVILAIIITSLFGAFDLFPVGRFEGVALNHGMKTIEIELARESFGMALIFAASVLCLVLSYRKSASA